MTSLREKFSVLRSKGFRSLRELGEDRSGVALTEFAFTFPILLTLGMIGSETAYYAVTHMRISQAAMQVADNASRVGDDTNLVAARRVYEADINEVFIGAQKLGAGIDLLGNGRVILSSLEQNSEGGQWIHWQRCIGAKNFASTYGPEGTGETGTDFPGMGDAGSEITASPGTAVMFVEVVYDYDQLTPFDFLEDTTLRYTAAFNVRDNRDLTRLYPDDPVVLAPRTCDVFSAS